MTCALIDGDIITYRVGFTCEEEEEWVAIARTDDLVQNILQDVNAGSSRIFLTSTDKSNYRFQLYTEYKAKRVAPKPIHYQAIRDYLVEIYKAEVIHGEEADDALGYNQTEDTIICSIDKDLLMIPGRHYNFVKKEIYNISEQEGLYNFYWQLLEGDVTDNIPGCPGVGKGTIPKLIHSDMNEGELFSTVYYTYEKQYRKKKLPNFESDMLRNGRLLWIKRKQIEDLWSFPLDKVIDL